MDNLPILVSSYVNPDLDGVAGAIAYAEFLQKRNKNAIPGIIGEPHDEAKYILDRFQFAYPLSLLNAEAFSKVILVDVSDLNGLEGKIAPERVIEIIDHRKVHEAEKFPHAKVQIESVGAAATLVAEKFIEQKVEISEKSATLLFAAIASNTLNFKANVTTSRDHEAARWLKQYTNVSENFIQEMFQAKSDLTGDKLSERIKGDFAWFTIGEKQIGISQIEMIGAEGLVNKRGPEIIKTLSEAKKELHLDHVFQSTLELQCGENIFVTEDEEMKKLLNKVFNVQFSGICAKRDGLIMRKEIVPLLKAAIETSSSI